VKETHNSNFLTRVAALAILYSLSAAKSACGMPVGDDLISRIDSYESEIVILSSSVCSGTAPTDEVGLKHFRNATSVLKQDAANLVELLNRESSSLEKTSIPISQKLLLQKHIEIEETALKASCPMLPNASFGTESQVRSSAALAPSSSGSLALPDDSHVCTNPGLYDIFPM
jgi:hypothetical protein